MLSKREIILIGASTLLILAAGLYIRRLHQTQSANQRLIEGQRKLLAEKAAEAGESANYIETICAEYRKLYQSYRQARYPDPGGVDKYVGLPGSAKGQIDGCYLPE